MVPEAFSLRALALAIISLVTGSLGSKRYSARVSVLILVPPWFDNKIAGRRSQRGISHKGKDFGGWVSL